MSAQSKHLATFMALPISVFGGSAGGGLRYPQSEFRMQEWKSWLRGCHIRKDLFKILFLAFCSLLVAQQSLNNDSVIKLVKAGLSEDLIVSTINAQPGAYDTSTDGLIALKGAGASDKVVAAIVAKAAGSGPAAAAPTSPTPTADGLDDPMGPHEPGIYLMTNTQEGKRKMVFIDRVGAGREKAHMAVFSASRKAEIPGPRAATRTTDANPVFYMYFPPTSNIGNESSISSPSQFSLLSLEDKKDHRETAVAKAGMFGHFSYGNDAKKTSLFSSERMRPYAYKVTVSANLRPGEYAFIATTTMAGSATGAQVVIYDFGVDGR
jgi:hypothetical protein